jgi:hypothetical protein
LHDVASKDAGGINGLAELPIGDRGGAPESIEPFPGSLGGMVAACLGPRFRPADVVMWAAALMGIILSRWMNFKRAGVGERSFGFCWGEFGMGEFARVFKRTIQEVFLSSVGMKNGDRM